MKVTHAQLNYAPEDQDTVTALCGCRNGVDVIASPTEHIRPGYMQVYVTPPGKGERAAGGHRIEGVTRGILEQWLEMFV